jgi:hypothetical protein
MTEDFPLLAETGGGISVTYRGRALYSSRDPSSSPERIASGTQLPERSIILAFSPLLWYGADILMARLPASSVALFVEADQNLMALALERLPARFRSDPRFHFIRTDQPAAAATFVAGLGPYRFRRVAHLALSGGYGLYREAYDAITLAIESDIATSWRNKSTILHLGRLWTRNIFLNLASCSRGIGSLESGKQVVVAGAGESLEAALPWIRQEREGLFVVAADTALPALVDSCIIPDLAVAVEAQCANRADFYGIPTDRVALACDLSSDPSIIRRFATEPRFFLSDFARLSLFDRMRLSSMLPEVIPPLGSVGVVAAFLARGLTDTPVLLTGLDFCFARGKTHARGTPTLKRLEASSGRLSRPDLYAITVRQGVEDFASSGAVTMRSDSVLSSYSTALDFEAKDGRFRALPGTRFPSPIAGIDFAEASAMASAPKGCSEMKKGEALADRAGRLDFIRDELKGIENLIEVFTGRDSGKDDGMVLAMMRDRDYLYLHFPDTEETPNLSRGFLNRVRMEAEYFRRLLSGILTRG